MLRYYRPLGSSGFCFSDDHDFCLNRKVFFSPEKSLDPPLDLIPDNRFSYFFAYYNSNSKLVFKYFLFRFFLLYKENEMIIFKFRVLLINTLIFSIGDYESHSSLTVRRVLPFSLRLARIFLPAFVSILDRNPCLFFLFRL